MSQSLRFVDTANTIIWAVLNECKWVSEDHEQIIINYLWHVWLSIENTHLQIDDGEHYFFLYSKKSVGTVRVLADYNESLYIDSPNSTL